jgi:hypothetical protein
LSTATGIAALRNPPLDEFSEGEDLPLHPCSARGIRMQNTTIQTDLRVHLHLLPALDIRRSSIRLKRPAVCSGTLQGATTRLASDAQADAPSPGKHK